jgi:hypothetical protein
MSTQTLQARESEELFWDERDYLLFAVYFLVSLVCLYAIS